VSVAERIEGVFTDAGARGFLHAHEIGTDNEVSVGGDEPVVLASVFKIAVAVAFAREVSSGRLDETEIATVGKRYRIGGLGTAGCAEDVRMSLRDLALFMLTMSDNAATDVIYHRLGAATVDAVLTDLNLTRTRIIGCCEDLFRSIVEDIGGDPAHLDTTLAAATDEQVRGLAVLDPARTSSSTPRETGALLDAIWTDRAAAPAACARVRDMMARQIWPHRLSSGFEADVVVAAKTGTLPTVRNESGVVSHPDGRQFAVAVFTRAASLAGRQPAIDAAIGHAARLAVDHLRSA
jgi:beta-lactamase class A